MQHAATAQADAPPTPSRSGRVGVFFDLDHTLIDTSSGLLYFQHMRRLGEVGTLHVVKAVWWMVQHKLNLLDVESLARREMVRHIGREEAPVRAGCIPWFEEYVRGRVYKEAVDIIAQHRAEGHHCALLSAASPYVCGPMQEHLQLDAMLCTRPVVEGGKFTGDFEPPYCYGEGKIVWAERHAAAHGLDLDASYFYSDSYSDLPMLARVGNPRIVNPDPKLRAAARERGWPILKWTDVG